MSYRIYPLFLLFFATLFLGCSQESTDKTEPDNSDGWKTESQVTKAIDQISFNFPASGHAFNNKTAYVQECFDALKSNSELIKLDTFSDTIQIRFLASREDMFWLTGMKASGIASPHINTLYVVADGEKSPPIKHELMHLMAMLEWGYPHYTSTWINEGLAAFAEDNCNGLTVAEIYRYFMENDMLISIDALTADFYSESEMIAYHQSAYVVEYLLNQYSLDQFKQLWRDGFDRFEEIYGKDFVEMKAEMEKELMKKHNTAPNIDWEVFKQGCN